ncbi:entity [Caudoviricetes sp.]|nr:entity [Caudoviricetes sp.]
MIIIVVIPIIGFGFAAWLRWREEHQRFQKKSSTCPRSTNQK